MSVDQPVPVRQAFLVEYPGYIRDPDSVVETLGGVDSLTAASQGGDTVLQLNFRPHDPLAHPIYAERQTTKGLLLKLCRTTADSGEGGVTAEIVASVHSKFTFTGMADYQYQSVASTSADPTQSDGPYGLELEPLLCIPPLFTKADVPLDYAFKNFRASDRPASSKTKQPPWIIPFAAPHVLPAQAPGPVIDQQQHPVALQLQARPVWTEAALAQQLPDTAQADLESQLQMLCYQFKDGPWQGAWIQRGRDPRQDSSTWKWQTLQYHLPPEWYSKLAKDPKKAASTSGKDQGASNASAEAAPSYTNICRFAALPMAQTTMLQLCDLHHPALQELLQQQPLAAQCSDASGWLTADSWKHVTTTVQELFAGLMTF